MCEMPGMSSKSVIPNKKLLKECLKRLVINNEL